MDKLSWPEFPLWWLEESRRNMDSLKTIASHLYGKTETYKNRPSGVRGQTTDVERQIIEHISVLQEQVGHLTDAVQSSLRLIAEDHYRRTHKGQRAVAWIREKASKYGNKLWNNPIFKVFGALSTLAFIIGLVAYLLHVFRK